MCDCCPDPACRVQICPNFALCQRTAPRCILACHGGRCPNCNMIRGVDLLFSSHGGECAKCQSSGMESLTRHPACGHWFCLPCAKPILLWTDTRPLEPKLYGSPSCPNGCEDDCACDAFDQLFDAWMETPAGIQYDDDNEMCNEACDTAVDACPICGKSWVASWELRAASHM